MRQAGLKPAAKIVLYWIADHHNGETGQCNPSIARIASCSEMSRRSVEAHISALEEAGLISVTQCYRDKGGKTSNSYTLCLAESDAQNLRIPPAKSAHGDAQNLRMKNLVIYNLGNEQESPLPPKGGMQRGATSSTSMKNQQMHPKEHSRKDGGNGHRRGRRQRGSPTTPRSQVLACPYAQVTTLRPARLCPAGLSLVRRQPPSCAWGS